MPSFSRRGRGGYSACESAAKVSGLPLCSDSRKKDAQGSTRLLEHKLAMCLLDAEFLSFGLYVLWTGEESQQEGDRWL